MAKILVAEDDDGVRLLTARALRLDGHEVDVAEDGVEALEMLVAADGDYDLVLSDIRMPAMTGIELAHAVHAAFPHLTVLLMTGYAEQREAADDLVAIIAGVVDKPFTIAEMRARVAELVPAAMAAPEPLRRYG
jgi:two-component system, cell cycle response regulator CpdR